MASPRYQLARDLLARERLAVLILYTLPYGESYFAAEELIDQFRAIQYPANTPVFVVGYGATTSGPAKEIIILLPMN